ncbi:ankyrin repeat domain-containing protein [Microvirga sp. BT350]|uniref:Ankyrin repeat domain-containing protein n=2 Tax=Microvirga alba TaxID=2791025 RepID=A0A931FNB6_9HYPH|nr:ankyrin repeat domain-containing protein [Microvirga alba]
MLLAMLTPVGALPMISNDLSLIEAAGRGDVASVRDLLAKGAGVNARDSQKRTALLAATQGDHVAAARMLIEAGADVNAQDYQRDSAYLLAGARGYLDILRLTLANGADLKSTNRYGGTALIPACERGHVETVRELLKTDIDVNHVNNLGWTGLMEAIVLSDGGPRHAEIVKMLIESGRADVNIPDRDGITPLQHAKKRGFREIAALLVNAGGR